jgi:hypothetical protein
MLMMGKGLGQFRPKEIEEWKGSGRMCRQDVLVRTARLVWWEC